MQASEDIVMDIYTYCFIATLGAVGNNALFSSPCFNGTNTRFCREIDYVANTHFLVLIGLRFDSDK